MWNLVSIEEYSLQRGRQRFRIWNRWLLRCNSCCNSDFQCHPGQYLGKTLYCRHKMQLYPLRLLVQQLCRLIHTCSINIDKKKKLMICICRMNSFMSPKHAVNYSKQYLNCQISCNKIRSQHCECWRLENISTFIPCYYASRRRSATYCNEGFISRHNNLFSV